MLTYIWIAILAIVVTAVFYLIRQQQLQARTTPELPSLERTIFTLQIGDIVQYMGTDWVVEGLLTYNDKGYTWQEYLLQNEEKICWLSVEEDDTVEVSLLEGTTALEVSSPPPAELNFQGEIYRCTESGTARMTRVGTTLNRVGEKCRYFDYEGTAGKVLSIEDWDGDIEITVGETIQPSLLSLLPGDGRRVYQ